MLELTRDVYESMLAHSLDGLPDPWFEHEKAAVDVRQFAPLAV